MFNEGVSAKTSKALDNLFLLLNFLKPELEALTLEFSTSFIL